MHIDIAPETERLVREEINSGHFGTADELIRAAVEALREKSAPSGGNPPSDDKSLFDLFTSIRGLLTDNEIDRYFSRDSLPGRSRD